MKDTIISQTLAGGGPAGAAGTRFGPAVNKADKSTPWEADFPPITTAAMWNDAYKNDPDRLAGKRGNMGAAKRFVDRYLTQDMLASVKRQYPGAVIVPIVDVETEGVNMLPAAFALKLSQAIGLMLDASIDKTNKTDHAHAKAMERLLRRAKFSGDVKKGPTYYLIADDFVSMGGTIADLRNYIIQNGGKVAGVATIGASNAASLRLPPTVEHMEGLEGIGRHELEETLREYGIANQLEDLTNAEAGVILRNRITPKAITPAYYTDYEMSLIRRVKEEMLKEAGRLMEI